jgi:hypothetical protein
MYMISEVSIWIWPKKSNMYTSTKKKEKKDANQTKTIKQPSTLCSGYTTEIFYTVP